MSAPHSDRSARTRLDFRGGGWVLVLAAVLVAAVIAWRAVAVFSHIGERAIGDGHDPETYGFSLEPCLVERAFLVGSGFPKDGLQALVNPPALSVAETEKLHQELREQRHGKLLVSHDRVIGVVIGGQPRAYPLRLLYWCEVVNDELGGVPICVTYNPLCDSVVVFDRRAGSEVKIFGVSGLVFNSNLVLYDRRESPREESLWSQLRARAIAGPAAQRSETLRVLPCAVMHWEDWRRLHPDTTVLAPDDSKIVRTNKRDPYLTYFADDRLRFPIERVPASPERLKSPWIAVQLDGAWRAWSLEEIAARAVNGTAEIDVDGRAVVLAYRENPPAAWITSPTDAPVMYSFRFAWQTVAEPMLAR